MKNKFKDIVEKIKEWHKRNGITVNGSTTTQYTKLVEELHEFLHATTKGQRVDALGDMIVVIIAILELLDLPMEYEELNIEVESTKELLTESILSLASPLIRNDKEEVKRIIINILLDIQRFNYLHILAETAYNEIKDRVGILLNNGNFVKGSELVIQRIDTNLFYTEITTKLKNKFIEIKTDAIPLTTQVQYGKATWQDFVELCNKHNITLNIKEVKEY